MEVELDLKFDVSSVFVCKTATMNPVAMAKFFHIICKEILLCLFINGGCDRDLLRPVSMYFGIGKTNGRSMLYLHC